MWEPLGNTTVLPPAKWHPEPQFRGTFGILSSCLITMSLCIWTSLHLNVPEHRKEHLHKYRKMGWMVLGLFAPELVVWNAWEQRKKVKELNALMRREGFMPKKSTARERISRWFKRTWHNVRAPFSPGAEEAQELADLASTGIRNRNEDRHNLAEVIRLHNPHLNAWTDVHSWLVVMGGFAFEDKSPEDQQFMPGTRQRIPISRKVFQRMVLFRPDQVPDISRGYIEDKSKSDWLAKGLTCWQAGYLCIQCIFRISQHLSITLLELNVFAHAICALLLFLVWWDKPRDILVPNTISSEEALQICAGHLDSEKKVVDAEGAEYRVDISPVPEHPPPDECLEIAHSTTIIVREHPDSRRLMALSDGNQYECLRIRDTYWRLRMVRNSRGPASKRLFSSDIAVELTRRDILRLVKGYEYITEFWPTEQHLSQRYVGFKFSRLHYRTPNWNLDLDRNLDLASGHIRVTLGLSIIGACYGGLHLIAWGTDFPSRAEILIWRAAAVTILATGPGFALLYIFAGVPERVEELGYKPESFFRFLQKTLRYSVLFVMLLLILWYVLCRTFIVVECFILLAHIPESALRVPTWAAYIPSFG